MLLVIDHAQAYFRKTKYMTPELNVLEPYHLSVPRMFLDILSGRKQFVSHPCPSAVSSRVFHPATEHH